MKKSITILVLCSLFAFAGILPGAISATGPSDALSKSALRPAFVPVITEGESVPVIMDEDASPLAFALTLNATDGDAGDTLTWSISSAASHGTATASGTGTSKVIGYVPNADWNGTDSFVVMVSDGADGSDTITVNVTVNARNDAPVNTALPTVAGTHHVGGMLTALAGTWNDSADLAPGVITFGYQWQRADEASGLNTIDISAATASTYTVTPADNLKYIRVRVTATDNGEGLPAAVSTTADSAWQPTVNASPVVAEGSPVSVTIDEDNSPASFNLTLHATDADGDALTWSISTPASHGTATVATGTGASQVINYTPALDYNTAAGGAESFVVQVDDGLGGTDTITVNVTVNARNDGPINTVPGAQMVDEDTNLVFSSGTGNAIAMADVDVDETTIPNNTLQVTLTVNHGSSDLAADYGTDFYCRRRKRRSDHDFQGEPDQHQRRAGRNALSRGSSTIPDRTH